MSFRIETLVNGPFQENCYLVWDDDSKDGILIDPGDEPDKLLGSARVHGVNLTGIFNTHGHVDHAGAVAKIVETTKIPFAIHPDDEFLLDAMPNQAAMFGLPPMEVPKVDVRLSEGDQVKVGSHAGKVLHTPGHSPGGVCFHFDKEGVVFVGDTLFAGSVGRSDLPGGSMETLIASIKSKLLSLDDDVKAFSGHGPVTTIGLERQRNPFLTGRF